MNYYCRGKGGVSNCPIGWAHRRSLGKSSTNPRAPGALLPVAGSGSWHLEQIVLRTVQSLLSRPPKEKRVSGHIMHHDLHAYTFKVIRPPDSWAVSNFLKEEESSHLFSPQPFNGQNERIPLNKLDIVSL